MSFLWGNKTKQKQTLPHMSPGVATPEDNEKAVAKTKELNELEEEWDAAAKSMEVGAVKMDSNSMTYASTSTLLRAEQHIEFTLTPKDLALNLVSDALSKCSFNTKLTKFNIEDVTLKKTLIKGLTEIYEDAHKDEDWKNTRTSKKIICTLTLLKLLGADIATFVVDLDTDLKKSVDQFINGRYSEPYDRDTVAQLFNGLGGTLTTAPKSYLNTTV